MGALFHVRLRVRVGDVGEGRLSPGRSGAPAMSRVHSRAVAEVRESARITGVYHVRPGQWPDARGRFVEAFRRSWIPGAREMVQGSRSDSRAGVLRGMHYHLFQADYVTVISGRMFAGLYDLRDSSPTRGASETFELDGEAAGGLYVPPGVAHGFWALTGATLVYLADDYHDGSDELGVRWDDPALGIVWPPGEPLLSERDRRNPLLAEISEENRPA